MSPANDDRIAELDDKGKRGNLLAGVGFALGAVGLGAGIALLVMGKRARQSDQRASVRVLPSVGGLTVAGRF